MSPGAVGPVEARPVLSSAHRGPAAELVALLDAAHARLHAERRGLALGEQAVASIAEEPFDDPRTTDAMTIFELAGALGVRPIGPLKELMPQFREARRWGAVGTALDPRAG